MDVINEFFLNSTDRRISVLHMRIVGSYLSNKSNCCARGLNKSTFILYLKYTRIVSSLVVIKGI